MKKFFIMSLFAATLFAQTAQAQTEQNNNTYSVEIKLADGTALSIGPNEVDNITFSDGKVTISGTTVSELVTAIKVLREDVDRIEPLEEKVSNLEHYIDELIIDFTQVWSRLNALDVEIGNLQRE